MVDRDAREVRSEPEYDVQLWRESPQAPEDAPWPRAQSCTTPRQTALVGEVRDAAQLESLLARVQAVGLVLDEVHRVAETSTADGEGFATYEIRVEGEIGPSLLCYLKWRHYVVPEQTLVRIAAGSAELLRQLKVFTDAGARIEQVRRVVPARQVGCA